MGTWMDQVTRGWLIYELTNSALQLGLVRGIQAIPFLLLSPIAGSAADRYPRKFQVVVAQFASGFLYAVTAALVLTGLIRPWHVYVTAFLMACVQVFLQPSRSAMISDFVPQKTLTSAIGLNAMVFNMARSTGPALSGLLISLSSTGISYAVQALFMVLATVWTTQLSKVPPGAPSQPWRARGVFRPKHHRRLEIQLAHPGSAHRHPDRHCRRVVHDSVQHAVAGLCARFTPCRSARAGIAADGYGDRRVVQLDLDRFGGRPHAARYSYARRRRALRRAGGDLFRVRIGFRLSMALMAIIGLCHVSSHALVQTVIQTYSPPEFRGRAIAIFHMTQVLLLVGGMAVGALSAMIGAPWAASSMSIVGTLCMVVIYRHGAAGAGHSLARRRRRRNIARAADVSCAANGSGSHWAFAGARGCSTASETDIYPSGDGDPVVRFNHAKDRGGSNGAGADDALGAAGAGVPWHRRVS